MRGVDAIYGIHYFYNVEILLPLSNGSIIMCMLIVFLIRISLANRMLNFFLRFLASESFIVIPVLLSFFLSWENESRPKDNYQCNHNIMFVVIDVVVKRTKPWQFINSYLNHE